MLELKPDKLMEHYEESKAHRDEHLACEAEAVRRMHGSGYKDDPDHTEGMNHQAAWLSVMLPRMMYRDPRITAVTYAAGRAMDSATAMKFAMNRISRQQRLGEFLLPVARDFSMFWSAVFVSNKRHPGMSAEVGDDSWMPQTQHLGWRQFWFDPHCSSFRTARYTWHTWVSDKEDLLKQAEEAAKNGDDSWDIEAIKAAATDTGLDEVGEKERKVKRDEIVGVEFWVRDADLDEELGPEDGFNGAIMSLALSGNGRGKFLRKPRPYYGSERGPHVLFGCYSVPGDPSPLAPLRMTEPQELAAMRMDKIVNRAAATYRRVALVPAGGEHKESVMKQLRTKRLDEIITVSGLPSDAKPIMVEIGGVTPQMIANKQAMDQNLEKMSGLDSQQNGRADADSTATAAAIADSATQTRASYIAERFHSGVLDLLERMAWFVWSDDRVMVPLGDDALQELGLPAQASGAVWQGGEEMPFSALDLDLDIMSVSRVTEPVHQRRMLQATQIIPQLVPQIRAYPEVEWKRILTMVGEALGMPDLGNAINLEFAAQLAGVEAPAEAAPPRMGGDLGLSGSDNERRDTSGRVVGAAMGVA